MSEELLTARLKSEMKDAMKSGDKSRLAVIRLMLSAIKQIEVDERIELDNARVIAVLDKMIKQRRESIRQYEEGSRQDLADAEAAEIVVIQEFMPKALSEHEIDTLIARAIEESGATSAKEMGKVVALLKDKVQGRADMAVVSAKIKTALA